MNPPPSPLYLLNSGPAAPAYNMACDEALLLHATSIAAPILRFYSWTEPAATFGYFQRYHDVAALTHLRPLIRRPTGGGIVPHDADWTYSLIVPGGHPWYQLRAIESYRRIHQWIADAFARLGLETQLAPSCQKTGPGQCFAGYEQFDLLWRGRKIAGAAQRRTRDALLIQGSVQPPAPLPLGTDRARWEAAMVAVARDTLAFEPREFTPGSRFHLTISLLHQTKYSDQAYNRKK